MRNRGKDKALTDKITQLEDVIQVLSFKLDEIEQNFAEALEILATELGNSLRELVQEEIEKYVNDEGDTVKQEEQIETCQHGVFRDPVKCGLTQGLPGPCACECHGYHSATEGA